MDKSTTTSTTTDTTEERVEVVQIDGLVALKIAKHCRENLPDIVTGQLLGLDIGKTVEITNSFPFPSEDQNDSGTEYQIEMMKCMREVNVDSNTVGWYTSSFLGSSWNKTMLESQVNFQTYVPSAIVLIYDPLRTSQGSLSLTAYRLSDKFLKLYKSNNFTKESITESNFSFKEIYEEIPVEIVNTGILRAMIFELQENSSFAPTFDSLDLATSSFLENNLELLIDCVGDLQLEQGKLQGWQRNVTKQQQHQQSFLQKRKAENQQRKLQGLELLPETQQELEIENPQIFKLPTEPSRLDHLLTSYQINSHCEDINKFGGQSLTKLFFSKSTTNK